MNKFDKYEDIQIEMEEAEKIAKDYNIKFSSVWN